MRAPCWLTQSARGDFTCEWRRGALWKSDIHITEIRKLKTKVYVTGLISRCTDPGNGPICSNDA